MSTRWSLMQLLRQHPGTTVADLASRLGVSGVSVRRHLDALASSGLAECTGPQRSSVGRPASGWRLTSAGMEQFPRAYAEFALDLVDDICDQAGDAGLAAILDARRAKVVERYRAALPVGASRSLGEVVERLAALRDADGYSAGATAAGDGAFVLTERNCAVHKVAERHPEVCAMELAAFREVLGPDVEVERSTHIMSGDGCCTYCIKPSPPARR